MVRAIRSIRAGLAALVMVLMALPASAQQNPGHFFDDTQAAVQDGLQWLRDHHAFTAEWGGPRFARGTVILALLEQEPYHAPVRGYNALTPADRALGERALTLLINDDWCGVARQFHASCHSAALMALVTWARTGGPEVPNAFNFTVRQSIDKLVVDVLNAQSRVGPATGFWGIEGPGRDSNSTQLAISGLAAARAYYLDLVGDAGAIQLLAEINEALARTADAYTRNLNPDGGFGPSIGEPSSFDQTGAALWAQILASRDVNNPTVQALMTWMAERYEFLPVVPGNYYYFPWVVARSYRMLEASGILPAPASVSVADLGTFPECPNRNPLQDERPGVRGWGGQGYYWGAQVGWRYDFNFTLMTHQDHEGFFTRLHLPTYNNFHDQAYAILILEGSVGGACVDSDGDRICDHEDVCAQVVDPLQADADQDDVGDLCDLCPGENDHLGIPFNGDFVCPAVCVDSRPPHATCHEEIEVEVDEQCHWAIDVDMVNDGTSDPDNHRVECWISRDEGVGQIHQDTQLWCRDECRTYTRDPCWTNVVPIDRLDPTVEVANPVIDIPLANDWAYNWTDLVEACGITPADNCTPHGDIVMGIISVNSDLPGESIQGEPGYFYSRGIVADYSGFMLNVDAGEIGERTYTFEVAAIDADHNWTTTECQVRAVAQGD